MKRLTFDGLFCDIAKCDSTPGGTFCETGTCTQRCVWERLKEYEDTGLEPEEIADFMKRWERAVEIAGLCKRGGIDHLLELKNAEQDGRLVNYLPGDTVYDRFGMEWTVTSSEIHKFDDGALRYLYRCGHSSTNDYCALYSDEILTREEADAALAQKGGEG